MLQVKDNLPVLVWMEVEYYIVCFETEEYTFFLIIYFYFYFFFWNNLICLPYIFTLIL